MSHLYFVFSIIFLSKLLSPNVQNALRSCGCDPGEDLGSPMPKWSNDSCLQENQESYTTCTLSMTCQIDVVNKQLK